MAGAGAANLSIRASINEGIYSLNSRPGTNTSEAVEQKDKCTEKHRNCGAFKLVGTMSLKLVLALKIGRRDYGQRLALKRLGKWHNITD